MVFAIIQPHISIFLELLSVLIKKDSLIVDDGYAPTLVSLGDMPKQIFAPMEHKREYRPWDYVQAKKEKTKIISVICSGKIANMFQVQRLRFVKALQEEMGDVVHFFGRDSNPITLKDEGLNDYRYHIVLENNRDKHFWSEKLADAYLAECYPIYYGCPNVHDYFSKNAYTPIDINHIPQAIQTIKNVIAADLWQKHHAHIYDG